MDLFTTLQAFTVNFLRNQTYRWFAANLCTPDIKLLGLPIQQGTCQGGVAHASSYAFFVQK